MKNTTRPASQGSEGPPPKCSSSPFPLALATAFASPAAADQIKIEEIAYNTADLTDATRLEALRSELRAAARRVCTVPGERHTLFMSAKRDCIERAYNDALLQIETRVAELDNGNAILSVEVR